MQIKPSTKSKQSKPTQSASPLGAAALAHTLARQYSVLAERLTTPPSGITLTDKNIKKLIKDLVWCSDEPRTRSTQTEMTLELIKSSIPLRYSLFTGLTNLKGTIANGLRLAFISEIMLLLTSVNLSTKKSKYIAWDILNSISKRKCRHLANSLQAPENKIFLGALQKKLTRLGRRALQSLFRTGPGEFGRYYATQGHTAPRQWLKLLLKITTVIKTDRLDALLAINSITDFSKNTRLEHGIFISLAMGLRLLIERENKKTKPQIKDQQLTIACGRAIAALSMSNKPAPPPDPKKITTMREFIKKLITCIKNINDKHTLICLCLLYLDIQQFNFIPIKWFGQLDMIRIKINTLTKYDDMIAWSTNGSAAITHERNTLIQMLLYRLSLSIHFNEILNKDDCNSLIRYMLTISSVRSTISEPPTPYNIIHKLTFVAFYRSWKGRELAKHNSGKKTTPPHYYVPRITPGAMQFTIDVLTKELEIKKREIYKGKYTKTHDQLFWDRNEPEGDLRPILSAI